MNQIFGTIFVYDLKPKEKKIGKKKENTISKFNANNNCFKSIGQSFFSFVPFTAFIQKRCLDLKFPMSIMTKVFETEILNFYFKNCMMQNEERIHLQSIPKQFVIRVEQN